MLDCYATGKQSHSFTLPNHLSIKKMKDDQTRITAPMFDCYATGKQCDSVTLPNHLSMSQKKKDDQTRLTAPMFDCYTTGKQSSFYFTQSSFNNENITLSLTYKNLLQQGIFQQKKPNPLPP